ncbi:hypothetical protein MKX03_009455, partial [Papaver bracteatum]
MFPSISKAVGVDTGVLELKKIGRQSEMLTEKFHFCFNTCTYYIKMCFSINLYSSH